jgi:hypothetical protein
MCLVHLRRDFLVDELVKSIDALSREQFRSLVTAVGLQNLQVQLEQQCSVCTDDDGVQLPDAHGNSHG